jgi:ribulose-5-phosphate 4-epimerase/fuculose-1-phosphate aldolase
MNEARARERLVEIGAALYDRGYTHGSTGNLSVQVDGGWLITPTNSCLGRLDPARISRMSTTGEHLGGDPPSKEAFLHLAMYQERPNMRAVVHLHATWSVAVSVLQGVDPADVLPPLTAYYAMRVGKLPLVPYHPPGDKTLAEAVRAYAGKHHALLLANHGPVVGASSLDAAADAAEELEQTAKLYLLLGDRSVRCLDAQQVGELQGRYGMP